MACIASRAFTQCVGQLRSPSWRAYLDKPAELTIAIVEHTVFNTKYYDVLMAAVKNRKDAEYLFDTTPFHALANDVDEAFKEKPGGGALDEEHDETNDGSNGTLPINSGGEAEALPKQWDCYGKYRSQRG